VRVVSICVLLCHSKKKPKTATSAPPLPTPLRTCLRGLILHPHPHDQLLAQPLLTRAADYSNLGRRRRRASRHRRRLFQSRRRCVGSGWSCWWRRCGMARHFFPGRGGSVGEGRRWLRRRCERAVTLAARA
jgi:hypothetical protein